ncbi:hypothetical protein RUM44_008707 [Polyplax serrata]|uniref:Uncharacterized protein n=1 Tax=Polyplax serrata TaxID=468196 RepID=A0ABR1BDV9_POLSC
MQIPSCEIMGAQGTVVDECHAEDTKSGKARENAEKVKVKVKLSVLNEIFQLPKVLDVNQSFFLPSASEFSKNKRIRF